MKIFILIGWRNLWRNKRRSLVVICSIALGIFAMLVSMGIMNGMNNQMVDNTISTSLGHISVHRRGFQQDMTLSNSFSPSFGLGKSLAAAGRGAAPRIKLEGMVRSSEASRGVLIVGIDPELEKTVTEIHNYILDDEESEWFSDSTSHDIIMSKAVAEKLDLLVGDKVVVMFQDIEKEIVGVAFKVRGLYQSPIDSFDKFTVFTGIRAMADLTGLGNRISQFTVRVDHRNQVDAAAAVVKKMFLDPAIEVLTWKQMAPNLLRAVQLFDAMMYIFFAIIFITVVFSIANTLIMAIMERFHEIGVMKSIGTRPAWIGALVIFEAVNLGLVGLAVGIAASQVCILILAATGIDFSFYMESVRAWGTGAVIYPSLKSMDIFACAVIVLANTLVAALYPAVKAARIKPLEALHYV